jgi:hypothetical protein
VTPLLTLTAADWLHIAAAAAVLSLIWIIVHENKPWGKP